jgi:hypothetical protein
VADVVAIKWGNRPYLGRLVRAYPTEAPTGDGVLNSRLWPYPDLCLIRLDNPPADHPFVRLGDLTGIPNSELYLGGYNRVYDGRTARLSGKSARLDGVQDLADGQAWQVADCEIAAGMSGGPVLDLRTGLVCAIVKGQRLPDTPMGGLVIPFQAIRSRFPDLWSQNRVENRLTRQWETIRKALWQVDFRARLTEEEWKALERADSELSLRPEDYQRIWWEMADEFTPDPVRRFGSILDLTMAVADLAPQPGRLDPLAQLIVIVGGRYGEMSTRTFRDYAERLASRKGQVEEFERYISERRPTLPGEAPPALVIRLKGQEPDPDRKLQLTIWRYPALDAAPKKVCERGPYDGNTISEIREAVTSVLASEIGQNLPPGIPLIEFVLPDALLDEPVERWTMNKGADEADLPQLGEFYPVVARFADWDEIDEHMWRSRGGEFRNGRTPPKDPDSWTGLWVCCEDDRDFKKLSNVFRNTLPLVAMTAWHAGEPAPRAVAAARHAGVSVILWRHEPCRDHDKSGAEPSNGCARSGFCDFVASRLSSTDFLELPERIRMVRAEAAQGDSGAHPGDGIAIVWDDPYRRPWADPPANRDPSFQRIGSS